MPYTCMGGGDTVQPEILVAIKFGSWALNRNYKNIKSGSLVRDCHTYKLIPYSMEV